MDIENVAEKRRKYVLERSKKGYALARSLGFNSYESCAMSGWAEKRIIALSDERKVNG